MLGSVKDLSDGHRLALERLRTRPASLEALAGHIGATPYETVFVLQELINRGLVEQDHHGYRLSIVGSLK
jgi:predicted transcriptional regulator